MDQRLLDKYFHDRCSPQELEQVLQWFQTEEGRAFLTEDIAKQQQQFAKQQGRFLYPPVESNRLFRQIQLHKKQPAGRNRGFMARIASILLVGIIVSALLYWSNIATVAEKNPEPALVSYTTTVGQQKVFQLSDGTKIRLNEESTLRMPRKSSAKKRSVFLQGEAYFEVPHDPDRPFVVRTGGAVIEDLGTKFNVKSDSAAGNVQVAVIQGKVALRGTAAPGDNGALLTKNNFGILRLSDNRITIEQANVANYLSWINKRFRFQGASLRQISGQLEHLYDVDIDFQTAQLKDRHLTADFEKTSLPEVLQIISRSLDLDFKMHGDQVIWTK